MLLMATLVFCGCDRGWDPTKSREAFVGDYTFVSTGNIDLYMGAVKAFTVPMDKEGVPLGRKIQRGMDSSRG